MISLILLMQAMQPDIELRVGARVKSVKIEQQGNATLEVRATPDAGSSVEARVEPRAAGKTELRNVQVNVRAQASIADPQLIRAEAETTTPQ